MERSTLTHAAVFPPTLVANRNEVTTARFGFLFRVECLLARPDGTVSETLQQRKELRAFNIVERGHDVFAHLLLRRAYVSEVSPRLRAKNEERCTSIDWVDLPDEES